MKSEIFVVSDFNSETGNRLDVPKSGLNLVLTFLLFFQIQLSQKNKSGTVSISIFNLVDSATFISDLPVSLGSISGGRYPPGADTGALAVATVGNAGRGGVGR